MEQGVVQAGGDGMGAWWENLEGPWPADHVPTPGIEKSLWRAFAARRRDPQDRCTFSAICRDAGGASRSSLAPGSCIFDRLRKEILVVQKARWSKASTPAERTEQRILEREERYGGSVMLLRKQLRAQDGVIAEYLAMMQAAQAETRAATAMVVRFLDDIKAGRLVMIDGTAAVLAQAEAFLAGQGRQPSPAVMDVVENGVLAVAT